MGHRCILICLTYPYTNTVNSSLLYFDTANSGECDIKEREKAEWWGDLTLNANTIYSDWGPPVQKVPVCC